ncbi:MAG: nucleotidyltransferase domain-containing protein, partial [Dietzia sp.]|nr:nucleotidyltransferase domain-containing protein [Dietzia sp.]
IARAIRMVQQAILPLRDELDLVVLFGSASRGEDRQGSDVDILVVAHDAASVQASLAQHQWLQPVVLTPERHMVLIAEDGTLAKETARGITIWKKR